jgi:uracil-DNA glycosylase
MKEVHIDPSWKSALDEEFHKPYWEELTSFVRKQYTSKTVYPAPKNVFRAFDLCPFEEVKVVIVGQDPYHGPKQANGLCFAVNEGIPLPPSLQNIFTEIKKDTGITPTPSGDLSRWAKQGVLMLNSVLTVLAGNAASHSGKGWEEFTDAAIKALNDKREHIVYMLWGKYAQNKGAVIDREKNLVLMSGHPSPFSSHLFFGNHHFSRCNAYLEEHGLTPIDWH